MSGNADSLGLAAALFLSLIPGRRHHVPMRGVAPAVLVLVVDVQTALVEVRLDVLRDGLAVVALDALDQHRLAVLQVDALLPRQLHVPHLLRYLELHRVSEVVPRAGVPEEAGLQIHLDEGGVLLALLVDHVIEEDGPSRQKLLLLFGGDPHSVDLIRDVDLACAFRGVGVVAGVGGPARGLVQFDIRGEFLTVPACHSFHEDGLARVQVLDLLLCQLHAAQGPAVEDPVVLEDVLDAPALGVDLDVRVELPAAVGEHSLDEYFLALAQVVLFLLRELHALYFLRDEDVLRTHGHHLVGEPVDAYEGGDVLPVASSEFHHAPHVARLQKVPLVLVGEDVPEIRAVQLGFLADAVDAQHHIPPGGLLEGQPGVGTQRG